MATHSSLLAWEIPRTGEPGGLQDTTKRVCTRMHNATAQSSLSLTKVYINHTKIYVHH